MVDINVKLEASANLKQLDEIFRKHFYTYTDFNYIGFEPLYERTSSGDPREPNWDLSLSGVKFFIEQKPKTTSWKRD